MHSVERSDSRFAYLRSTCFLLLPGFGGEGGGWAFLFDSDEHQGAITRRVQALPVAWAAVDFRDRVVINSGLQSFAIVYRALAKWQATRACPTCVNCCLGLLTVTCHPFSRAMALLTLCLSFIIYPNVS